MKWVWKFCPHLTLHVRVSGSLFAPLSLICLWRIRKSLLFQGSGRCCATWQQGKRLSFLLGLKKSILVTAEGWYDGRGREGGGGSEGSSIAHSLGTNSRIVPPTHQPAPSIPQAWVTTPRFDCEPIRSELTLAKTTPHVDSQKHADSCKNTFYL